VEYEYFALLSDMLGAPLGRLTQCYAYPNPYP
jgi:hypothetical protein